MSDFLLPGEEPKEDIPAPADVAASDNTQMQSSFLLPGEQALSSSLKQAVAVSPDDAAKTSNLSQATGIPTDVVARNQDAVENQAKVASIQSTLQTSPVLAKQMTNPSFAAVAHDDVHNLSNFEQVAKGDNSASGIGGAAWRGVKEGYYDAAGFASMVLAPLALAANYVTPGDHTASDWYFKKTADPNYNALDSLKEQDAGNTFSQKLAGSVGTLGINLAEIAATGGASEAPQASTALRVLTNASEHAIKSMWMPATINAVNTGKKVYEATGDGNAALKAAEGQYVATTGMGLVPLSAQGGLLARLGTGFLSGTASGEASRQLTNATMPDNMQTPFSWEDTFLNGTTGSLLGAVMGPRAEQSGMAAAIHKSAEATEAAGQTTQDHANISSLMGIAATDPLRERSPQDFAAFAQSVADEGPHPAVFIDARILAQEAQAKGFDIGEKMPETAEQMKDAIALGGDVRIPLGELTTALPGSGLENSLMEHMRTSIDGPTLKEVNDKTLEAETQKQVEQIMSQHEFNAAIKESGMSVENELMTQLNEANRFTPDVNKVYAKLAAATFKTRAAQLGITPEEMYVRYPLEVQSTLDKVTGRVSNEMDQTPTIEQYTDWVRGKSAESLNRQLAEAEAIARGEQTETQKQQIASGISSRLMTTKEEASQEVVRLKQEIANVHARVTPEALRDTYEMHRKAGTLPALQNAKDGYNQAGGNENEQSGQPVRAAGEPEELYRTVGGGGAKPGWTEATRIRRDNGEPATLYRGAARPLGAEDFGHEALGVASGHPSSGLGVFFSVSKAEAATYGDVGGYHLDLRNPFTIKAENLPGFDTVADAAMWREKVRKAGHDGIIISAKHLGGKVHVVAFEPEQVIHPKNELAQPAYHGSPHDFDKFSTDHIGSGEGNQAYGWGLYFAENPDIAKDYQRRLSSDTWLPPQRFFKGEKLTPGSPEHHAASLLSRGGTLAQVRKEVAGWIAEAETWDDARKNSPSEQRVLAGWKRTLNVLNEAKTKKDFTEKPHEGNLYQVDIPDEHVARMLDWDAPLSEQSPEIQEALYKLGIGDPHDVRVNGSGKMGNLNDVFVFDNSEEAFKFAKEHEDAGYKVELYERDDQDPSGEELYRKLEDRFGDDKAASKALNDVGIPGIRFDDGGSRDMPFRVYDQKGNVLGAFHTRKEAQAHADSQPGHVNATVEDEGTHNLVVFDHDIIKLTHKDGKPLTQQERDAYFQSQQSKPEASRGKITFGDDITKQPSVIHLLENADLSTFVHELGHFNLEVLNDLAKQPDAPIEVRADMDALLKWFGVKDLDAWNGMSLDEKRPFHEQFARGFESYLFEGKSPNTELNGVFSRVRAWMVNVYKSLASLNVNLTPEVRGVFDRMLATNEQILDAEAQRGELPMFKTAEEAGATPEEWKAYQEQQQEQTQDAVNQLQSRSLRDMQWLSNAKSRVLRSLQRDAKAKRTAVEAEVTNEVNAQPTYQAQHFLKTGEMRAENGDLVKVDKGAKLDTSTLKEMYPDTMLNRPDLSKLKGMTREGGLHPDLVADMFGHTSGDQLVRELVNLQPKKDVIEGMTDQRMLERYGDLTSPDAMDRAANEALANEAHLKMLATELRFVEKAAGQRSTLVKAAKEFAAQIIARKKVGDINPRQFEVAENKARKAAQEAHLKGDRPTAAQAKREQLVNAHAAKMAYAALDEIRKGSDYQKKFDKDSIRNKIDVDIRDQIDALRERFDFRQTPPTGPTRAEQNLQEWMEGQIAAGYAPMTTPDMLNPAVRMHYKDMSLEQFRGFIDTVKSLEHIGRERRNITLDGQRTDLNDYVKTKLVPKMQERGERFTKDQLLDKPEDRHTNPIAIALDHFNSWRRSVAAQLKPQEFKRNEYDRHELLGPFGEALFDPVINANYRKVTMLKELSKDFQAEAEKLGREWQDSLREGVTNNTLIDPDKSEEGSPVYLNITRGKMLGMAIHAGNESNFNKLAKGWGWEPGDVWKFLHTNMSEKDWQATQAVWDLYEKHWPDMEAMNRRLGNTSPDKIEPRPFRTQFGEMRGGYAAISYDPVRSRRGEKVAAGESINPAEGLFNRSYFRAESTTNGSLNKRVDSYIDRVDLDFHGIARHLNETIHDLAYREALIDANKVIEHPEFRREFKKAYGAEAYKSMRDWLGQLANSNNTDQSVGALGKFLQYTRTGMVINAIAFRASTVLKHGGSAGIKTLGYFAGGGEKYLASRMASMGTDYKNQIEGAVEKFGEIRNRLTQQDRDFRATSASMFEPESKRAKAERFGHAAVAWSDMMTAVPTAWAAYDRAIAEGIPESQGGTGQPMTEKQAITYANKIVREAHGSTAEAARSMVLNTQSEAMKMFTTLYGFMNNTYGQQLDAYDKLRTNGISNAPVLARSFMAILVPALWAGFLSHRREDGDTWAGWVGKAISGEVASSVPFVRDAYSMAEGHSNAGLVAAESWLSSIVQAGKDVARASQGDSGKTKPIKDIANAVGTGLHVPGLGQLGGTLQYAADVHAGKENPASTREYLEGLAMGHAPKH